MTNNIIPILSIHRNTHIECIYDVLLASRRRIPRGCRTEYIPGQIDQSKSLYYEAYNNQKVYIMNTRAYKSNYLSSPFDAAP